MLLLQEHAGGLWPIYNGSVIGIRYLSVEKLIKHGLQSSKSAERLLRNEGHHPDTY
jgi:hypothetical protein